MTILTLLAATDAPKHLDPVQLFLGADIVVQVVIAGLVLASIWVWTLIVAFAWRIGGLRRRCDAYEKDFWQAADFDALQAERGNGNVPSARVASGGLSEWRRSRSGKSPGRHD